MTGQEAVGRLVEPLLGGIYASRTDRLSLALADLREAVGPLGDLLSAKVTRWRHGLPQYEVGHAERVAAIQDAIDGLPGTEVCGALYEGVGIAACVASGRKAAARLLAG
ncbi:hypothetical protein [Streptomyces microflavus]|uniref:hypothetical protein n=1 Tax=Streptomyces microflavus TaxID=1919 RepID=UPI0033CE8A01